MSFIGVIVATFVAVVGIFGVFNLTTYSLKAAEASKMRLIASGIAQEGIEIIREIRKSNGDWRNWEWYATSTPYVHPVGSSQIYCVQFSSEILENCPDPEIPLRIDASGLYRYDLGEDTSFYRRMILSRISDDEIKVVSEIKWQTAAGWQYLIVEDRLWKWR